MRSDAPREADRPIGELLRELGDEISTLVRQEIALAKVEIAEKTNASTTTVTRVAHWLRHGEGGYRLALERAKRTTAA